MRYRIRFLRCSTSRPRSAPPDSTFLDVDLPDLISGASGGESARRLRGLGPDMSSIGTSRLHRQRFGSDGVRSPGRGKHLRHRSTTIVKESCGRRLGEFLQRAVRTQLSRLLLRKRGSFWWLRGGLYLTINDASGCLPRALLLASGHTGCGDLPDQRATAHVPMACRWPPVATCHRANFCSVVDSKRRILATRPCAETEHCDFAMRVLMAQEIEQLAYEH